MLSIYIKTKFFSTFLTVALYLASNNEIEASFTEHPLDEDPVLIVLLLLVSLPA